MNFGIQTKWTEFRPNSDHFWASGLNLDWLRKIRPEWQQCRGGLRKPTIYPSCSIAQGRHHPR